MREVLRLSETDYRLLTARCRQHGNSAQRMRQALAEAGAESSVQRLAALRQMELRAGIDLGEICHRFERRHDADTHDIERLIMDFIAEAREGDDGLAELWIMLDRVDQVRELKDGRLVGEIGS
jgi:hypothetical protein